MPDACVTAISGCRIPDAIDLFRRAVMRFVIFTPFARLGLESRERPFPAGIATELLAQGHAVRIFEPRDGWSLRNPYCCERRGSRPG